MCHLTGHTDLELLNHACILANLSADIEPHQLVILEEVDSTNQYALMHPNFPLICLAEYQTQGRGRHGRQWISPFASGLCLSIKQRYTRLMPSLSGLNIALAVTVANTLQQFDISNIRIKWPNDIQWQGRKLAGLLLENRWLANKYHDVVIGIGTNVKMPAQEVKAIDQLWVDLYTITGKMLSRNALAAQLIDNCLRTLITYSQTGLTGFMATWHALDVLYGQTVTLQTSKECIIGIAQGIDEHGALILQVDDQKRYYNHGEVSVRL